TFMQILIHTDNRTELSAELREEIQTHVEEKLRRFTERITRLDLRLSDENSPAKGGPDDQQCVIDARLSGLQPISVTDRGATPDLAGRGAAGKMRNLIESTLGKKHAR